MYFEKSKTFIAEDKFEADKKFSGNNLFHFSKLFVPHSHKFILAIKSERKDQSSAFLMEFLIPFAAFLKKSLKEEDSSERFLFLGKKNKSKIILFCY